MRGTSSAHTALLLQSHSTMEKLKLPLNDKDSPPPWELLAFLEA